MLRILVATDGSEPAVAAVRAAASLAIPGSVMRAVSVVTGDYGPVAGALEGADPSAPHEHALREARELTGMRNLQLDLRRGDAAAGIVAAAVEFGTDLVVTGSRSYGPLATVLLGSTSVAVVDRAPCPVLVVRTPVLEPILLATDGSDPALTAESVLHWWPRHACDAVTVLAVRPHRGLPGLHLGSIAGAPSRDVVPADAAAEAADRLLLWGVPSRAVTTEGDAGPRIVATAASLGVGLIVVGTHGRTGVRRVLLGSVARSVLTHAECSVLIVRPTPAWLTADARERLLAGRTVTTAPAG
jgi:nucleotide-binding universal stress UspA family protein